VGTVFITGIAGFLGSHLADRFLQDGWSVTGIDDLSGGFKHNVPEGTDFRVANCLDRESYADLAQRAELVFHCAAAAYDGLSIFAPSSVYLNTVQATVEVLTASLSGDMRRFVFCSSMARYGALEPPFREDMEPHPVTPYGCAKLSAERAVENLATLHGRDFSIAVPHNIIGERQNFIDPYRNVAAIMINRMLRGEQPIIYGDGSQVRCFSFVSDVVDCVASMGVIPEASREVVNVGPDEGAVSILELAATIADILGMPFDPIFFPARPHEVHDALCSAVKARELLGYRTMSTLREGLVRMVDWIAGSGPKRFEFNRKIEIPSSSVPRTWTDSLI
jgi:UDP-glucose 4-epimerase